MQRKRFMEVLILILAVFGIGIGYVLYNFTLSPESSPEPSSESEAVDISKQSSAVQSFLGQHPSAEYRVTKIYVTSDGIAYSVSNDWELERNTGSTGGKPADDKSHYCWLVTWYDPKSAIPYIVDVFVDKDTSGIILVVQAE